MSDGVPFGIAFLVALAVVGYDGGQCIHAQPAYPAWFKTSPSGGTALWAVGYAPAYSNLSDGVSVAKADAYDALRAAHRMVILGEKLYEDAPGYGASIEGRSFVRMGLPDTLHSVSYVDSVRAGGMTLVLATWAPDGGSSRGPSSSRSPFSSTRPSWVEQELHGGHAARRAVGIAPRYYNLESSWRTAETRARRRLAFKAASHVRSLNTSSDEWKHDVKSILTGVLLRRAQVVARWADKETCYVLVEGTVEAVFTQ
ncbi:hypothetical protein [Salinibacter sp. 10B]|uniref:hypothetical protein n=1 Tax=Salinibacter sp. 10B TaxID=1923971 RepID=UPI0011B02210|nr:hypothetical protein [Salinibacter sp. 10B]